MTTKKKRVRYKCDCPIYCRYCGRHRSRDFVGHYCKTPNCQWRLGFPGCQCERKHTEKSTVEEKHE